MPISAGFSTASWHVSHNVTRFFGSCDPSGLGVTWWTESRSRVPQCLQRRPSRSSTLERTRRQSSGSAPESFGASGFAVRADQPPDRAVTAAGASRPSALASYVGASSSTSPSGASFVGEPSSAGASATDAPSEAAFRRRSLASADARPAARAVRTFHQDGAAPRSHSEPG